jgi:hypothetical protein
MKSKTTLIGNSKVMAHLLPNLVPPIDRQYTLNYLHKSKSIVNGLDKEWKLFEIFIREFFFKVAEDKKFQIWAKKCLKNKKKYPLDTSIPKIIDNIIIGASLKG